MVVLSATYSTSQAGESVTIEQEPWPESRGVVTAGVAMAIMAAFIQAGTLPDGQLNCADLPAGINVYPQPVNLDYSLHTSWGLLSGPVRTDIEVDEAVTVNFRNPTLPGPVQGVVKIDYLVGPFDAQGNTIPRPSFTLLGNELVFADQPFYAGLRVRYVRHRHHYRLTLPGRSGATENAKQATVYALFHGEFSWLETSPPPESGICMDAEKWGDNADIDPDDPDGDGAPINKKTVLDYCDNSVIRESVI